jgi:hypothetical protein
MTADDPSRPNIVTFTPSCPVTAAGVLEQMYCDVTDLWDNGDDFADQLIAIAEPHAKRLDELLAAAWDTFVAETSLRFEYVEPEPGVDP